MEEPEDEPLNYDDIGMEDPDEVYQTVALNKLQAKEKSKADAQQDRRADWDMRRADDQFGDLDAEYQADQQATANAKQDALRKARADRLANAKNDADKKYVAPRMDPTKRPKRPGKVTAPLDTPEPLDPPAPADKDLSPGQLKVRRGVQDKYGLDKDLDIKSQTDDMLSKANKGKDLKFKPNPKNFRQELVKPDASATDTDDFGNPLQTTDDHGNYDYDKRRDARINALNNLQFNSEENDATPVNEVDEMDRMLRIAGLR
jgi:hypothetical protein